MPDWNLRLRRLAALLLLGDAALRLRSSWLRARRETTAELWTRQNLDRIMDTAVVAVVEQYEPARAAAQHAAGAFEPATTGDLADAAHEAATRWRDKNRSWTTSQVPPIPVPLDLPEPIADAAREQKLADIRTRFPQTTEQHDTGTARFDLEWARQQVRARHARDFQPTDASQFRVSYEKIAYFPYFKPSDVPSRPVDWVGVLMVFDRDTNDNRRVVPAQDADNHSVDEYVPQFQARLSTLVQQDTWSPYVTNESKYLIAPIRHLWLDQLTDADGNRLDVLCGAGTFDLADLARGNLSFARSLWTGSAVNAAAELHDVETRMDEGTMLVEKWKFTGASLTKNGAWPECRIWLPAAPLQPEPEADEHVDLDDDNLATWGENTDRSA